MSASRNLASMFPDVNGTVKSGKLSIDAAMDAWASIASDFNPSPMVVILHGSVLTGHARPYSDIDLVLVSRGGDRIGRRPIVSSGYLLDVTVFPVTLIEITAKQAAQKLSPARICGFLSGLPIAGNVDLFTSAKLRVEAIYEKRSEFVKRMSIPLENKLLGILSDLAFVDRNDIAEQLIQEATFVALSLVSIRVFHEVLPPSIILRKCDSSTAELISQLGTSSDKGKEPFTKFILEVLGFNYVSGWGQLTV